MNGLALAMRGNQTRRGGYSSRKMYIQTFIDFIIETRATKTLLRRQNCLQMGICGQLLYSRNTYYCSSFHDFCDLKGANRLQHNDNIMLHHCKPLKAVHKGFKTGVGWYQKPMILHSNKANLSSPKFSSMFHINKLYSTNATTKISNDSADNNDNTSSVDAFDDNASKSNTEKSIATSASHTTMALHTNENIIIPRLDLLSNSFPSDRSLLPSLNPTTVCTNEVDGSDSSTDSPVNALTNPTRINQSIPPFDSNSHNPRSLISLSSNQLKYHVWGADSVTTPVEEDCTISRRRRKRKKMLLDENSSSSESGSDSCIIKSIPESPLKSKRKGKKKQKDPSLIPEKQVPTFDTNGIFTQADGTVLGRLGNTSVLCTVIVQFSSENNISSASAFEQVFKQCIQRQKLKSFIPLEVEYRERFHAAGKIPTHNSRRRDNNGPMSEQEVLAARAIDRVIRPWLMSCWTNERPIMGVSVPENIFVNCQVQSYDIGSHMNSGCNDKKEKKETLDVGSSSSSTHQQIIHASPIALAVNSAIAALCQVAYSDRNKNFPIPFRVPACIHLAMTRKGIPLYNPTPKEVEDSAFELLFAGTQSKVLMIELSAKNTGGQVSSNLLEKDANDRKDPGIPEEEVKNALELAHDGIIPIIRRIELMQEEYSSRLETRSAAKDEELMSDLEVAKLIGLTHCGGTQKVETDESEESGEKLSTKFYHDVNSIIAEAQMFVWKKMKSVALKTFGNNSENSVGQSSVIIHQQNSLLSKKARGRREHIFFTEIFRLLREEFRPSDEKISIEYDSIVRGDLLMELTNLTHESIMKLVMDEFSERNLRLDGRQLHGIRPISATVPMFPDCVHGSALFSRGETQVLCTATVGAPRDGLPIVNPYVDASLSLEKNDFISKRNSDEEEKIPVGSLRFLRSQVEMESDMNTRKIKAGREMTGDSGVLSEVKRMFLHYDFPDFSTGTVKSNRGSSTNRRAIGHGSLAEKAILPVLPHPSDFPYVVRLTCEVTSSNGSSSMASACGATLAMLDAGIPLIAPVAGVSVGITTRTEELLLDITGTEDHFGGMDLKVCGTPGGITAIQCDVKKPRNHYFISNALDLAKEGRLAILNAMDKECANSLGGLKPRSAMKTTAPRVEVLQFDPNRKRDLIGPGGSVLRQLEDRFNVSLDLSQDGRCLIFGSPNSVSEAKNVILDLVGDVEEGGIYEGTIIEIKDYGAIVELLRNKEGLLHVSEIADTQGKHPEGNLGLVKEYLKVGDKVEVLCTKIDPVQGSIKLSRKKLLQMREKKYIPSSNASNIEKSFSGDDFDNDYNDLDDDYETYQPFHSDDQL